MHVGTATPNARAEPVVDSAQPPRHIADHIARRRAARSGPTSPA
jgi:hypothetical protein